MENRNGKKNNMKLRVYIYNNLITLKIFYKIKILFFLKNRLKKLKH